MKFMQNYGEQFYLLFKNLDFKHSNVDPGARNFQDNNLQIRR